MPFNKLYHQRQALGRVVPLFWYLADAQELQWVARINLKRSGVLNKQHLRGMIIQHQPGFMPQALDANYTIILAVGMDPDEERFVAIKELMHCYFGPDGGGVYATNSEIGFENHMNEFFNGSTAIRSEQVKAEKKALWMAMAVLCPEQIRRDYKRRRTAGEVSYVQIAQELHITESRAKILLSDQYDREVSALLGK